MRGLAIVHFVAEASKSAFRSTVGRNCDVAAIRLIDKSDNKVLETKCVLAWLFQTKTYPTAHCVLSASLSAFYDDTYQ